MSVDKHAVAGERYKSDGVAMVRPPGQVGDWCLDQHEHVSTADSVAVPVQLES